MEGDKNKPIELPKVLRSMESIAISLETNTGSLIDECVGIVTSLKEALTDQNQVRAILAGPLPATGLVDFTNPVSVNNAVDKIYDILSIEVVQS